MITFQNGVDSVERLAPILGEDNVVGGTAAIATVISAPGVITHTSPFAQLRCGRVDGKPDARLSAFTDAAKAAGIDITLTDTINPDRWKKFVFLVGLSGMTGATRVPLGPILADPDTRAMFEGVMQEVVAVGRAKGVRLPDDFVADRMRFAEGLAARLQGLAAARSRARQPARARLARRPRGLARPRARRAGAAEHRDLRRAQAAPDGTIVTPRGKIASARSLSACATACDGDFAHADAGGAVAHPYSGSRSRAFRKSSTRRSYSAFA